MLDQNAFAAYSKAIAGGIAGLIIAELAKYGLNLPIELVDNFVGVIVTAALGYLVGHAAVYVAPKNKE